jgi:hypothetical protein
MSEESERLFRASWTLVLIGAAAGSIFAVLHRFVLGGLLPFGLTARAFGMIAGATSLALGWGVSRVAERLAGCCGEVLLFPVLLCGLAAAVAGLGLVGFLDGAHGDGPLHIIVLTVGFWGIASAIVILDRLRV